MAREKAKPKTVTWQMQKLDVPEDEAGAAFTVFAAHTEPENDELIGVRTAKALRDLNVGQSAVYQTDELGIGYELARITKLSGRWVQTAAGTFSRTTGLPTPSNKVKRAGRLLPPTEENLLKVREAQYSRQQQAQSKRIEAGRAILRRKTAIGIAADWLSRQKPEVIRAMISAQELYDVYDYLRKKKVVDDVDKPWQEDLAV